MNRKFTTIFATTVALILVYGCGKKETSSKNDSEANPEAKAESNTETVDIAVLDKEGDEKLASSAKAEARQWLKEPSHTVFKGDKQKMVQLVDDYYSAGATTVYVTDMEPLGNVEVTEIVLIVLPKDSVARSKLFAVAARAKEETGEDPDKDIGQKYLWFMPE